MRTFRSSWLIFATFCFLSATSMAQGLPPKQPGITRVGIVQPRVQVSGADAATAAESIRNILAGYLQGPQIEVVLIGSRLPTQYRIEARDAECDYIITTKLAHRRGSEAGGARKVLGALSDHAPYLPGADGAKAAIAATVLRSAQDFAANVRARDDMELAFKVETPAAGKAVLEKTLKRRASEDGEDLLTPLVERMAEAVGAAM